MDNNWQEWKERIVGYTRKIKQADRGQKRTRLAILFLCGLLLLVVAVPVPKTGEVDKDTKIDGESRKGETYETDAMADYEKYLENRGQAPKQKDKTAKTPAKDNRRPYVK